MKIRVKIYFKVIQKNHLNPSKGENRIDDFNCGMGGTVFAAGEKMP